MKYKEKSKAQFLSENEALRKRILELEEAQRSNEFLERALLDSEQRYRDLYENAPLGYQSLDADGNIVEVNDAWCSALGYKRADIIGMKITGFLTMDSNNKFKERFSELKKTGKDHSIEFEMVKKDGSHIIMSIEGRSAYDIHGNFKKSHCILHDITERKRSEDALKESEEKFKTLAEQSPNMIFINRKGQIVYANKKCEEIMGYKREEFYTSNFNFIDLIAPEHLSLLKENFNRHLKGEDVEPYEYALITKFGKKIDTIITTKLIQYADDTVILGIITDITEHKQAEYALQESERRLKKAQQISKVGDYEWILDTNKITWSDGLYKIFGFPIGSPVTRDKLFKHIHQDDIEYNKKIMKNWLKEGGGEPYEYKIIRADGTVRNIYEECDVVHNEKGKVEKLFGVVQDITDSKQAESQRAAAHEALQEREKKLESIFKVAPVGIGLVSNRVLLDVNDRFCKMTGYTKKDLIGKNARLLYPTKRDYDYVGSEKYKQIKKKGTGTVETRFKCKDGKIIDVSLSSTPLNLNDLKAGVTFTALDITERKRAENTLKESERVLRESQAVASIGSYLLDIPSGIWNSSEILDEIFGIDKDFERSVEGWLSIVHPEWRQIMTEYFTQDVLEKRSRFDKEYKIKRINDNVECWVQGLGELEFDSSANPIRMIGTIQDITERKNSENALRKAEEKYRSIFENAVEGIYQTSPDGKFISANPALAKMLGYKSFDELTKTVSNIEKQLYVDVKSRREFRKMINKHNDIKNFETQLYHKTGKKMWVSLNSRAVRDRRGKIQFYEGMVEDITESKLRGEKLKISEELNRAINENSPIGISIRSNTGQLLGYNKSWKRIWARSLKEINEDKGRVRKKLKFDKRDIYLGKWQTDIEKIYKKGGTLFIPELKTISRKKKAAKWISNYFYAIKDIEGKVDRVVILTENITNRKIAEYKLLESESRLKVLFEYAPDAIFLIDKQGTFSNGNKAAEKLTGYEKGELLNRKFTTILSRKDIAKAKEIFDTTISGSPAGPEELEIIRSDRKRIFIEIRTFPVKINKQSQVIGIARDVTARKKVEDEILNSREQLRNLSSHLQSIREEERGVIAREIHDDLGQSLTALKMDVSWLNKHLLKNREKTRTKINGMDILINETIRSVQRISSELRPGILDDLGLSSAIRWYANEFVSRTGIKCRVTIIPKEIKLGEKLSIAIYRIFQESLTNVIRHANATRVNVSFTLKKNNLNLVVKDNGIGIKNDLINDPKSLGLIGMQERVYPWNGTVDIYGSKGKGTAVSINVKC